MKPVGYRTENLIAGDEPELILRDPFRIIWAARWFRAEAFSISTRRWSLKVWSAVGGRTIYRAAIPGLRRTEIIAVGVLRECVAASAQSPDAAQPPAAGEDAPTDEQP